MILDEPTSAMDAKAEYEVFKEISRNDSGADCHSHQSPSLES